MISQQQHNHEQQLMIIFLVIIIVYQLANETTHTTVNKHINNSESVNDPLRSFLPALSTIWGTTGIKTDRLL
jgi:hypothetical protein